MGRARSGTCDDSIRRLEESSGMGIVLADLMRHLVNAYEQHMGLDRDATFRQIRAEFEAEIDSPTDKPTGSVL
jgi:hypothetical protein